MTDTDAALDLRRRLALARLLLQACAPPSRERTEACAALGECLDSLRDDDLALPADD